jgi:hypothetical protein
MATSKGKTEAVQDDVDAMFEGADEAGNLDDLADVDDLLNEVEEDDSEGWVPSEPGEGIAGRVIKVGQTRSDFAKDGEDPMCPTVTIQTRDGAKFRVIGYGAVLRRELMDKNPQVGDLMAVKYFGEKPIRKGRFAGKPYKHFGVVVKRAVTAG